MSRGAGTEILTQHIPTEFGLLFKLLLFLDESMESP